MIVTGKNAFASKIKRNALKAFRVYHPLIRRVIRHLFTSSPSSTGPGALCNIAVATDPDNEN
jgi:hypothetical protein